MQVLPWGPEFRTWKSWLGLESPDKDLEVLIRIWKSWFPSPEFRTSSQGLPITLEISPLLCPLMSAIELKIAGRRGVHQLSWQKLVPISETISRFQVGKWWNLMNQFANCEIAIEFFSRKSLLESITTCPRVHSTWWVIIFLLCWIFSQTISHQVGNVDEVVAKAEKLLAEAAAN